MNSTLQDILGLLSHRMVKIPEDKDYMVIAGINTERGVLTPQPKLQSHVISLGSLKTYILENIPVTGAQDLQSVLDEGSTVDFEEGGELVLLGDIPYDRQIIFVTDNGEVGINNQHSDTYINVSGYQFTGYKGNGDGGAFDVGRIEINEGKIEIYEEIQSSLSDQRTSVSFEAPVAVANIKIPAKPTDGDYILATLDDIPPTVNTEFINVNYTSTISLEYNSLEPNFEIDITGDLDLTLTGTVNGDSGLVNLYFSSTEVATLNGFGSLVITGTGEMVPVYFIHDGDGLKWYSDGAANSVPTLQQVTTAGATTNVPTNFETTDPDFDGISSITATSDNGNAIYAQTGNGIGVYVKANNGIAIAGSSINGIGVNAQSNNGVSLVTNTLFTNTLNIAEFKRNLVNQASISYDGKITANSFIKTGGLSTQFLMADGNTSTSTSYWTANGDDIYKNNSGNVGIGTTSPGNKLEINSGVTDESGLTLATLTNPTPTQITDIEVPITGLPYQPPLFRFPNGGSMFYITTAGFIYRVLADDSKVLYANLGSSGNSAQVTFDPSGNMYVIRIGSNIMHKITTGGVVSVFATATGYYKYLKYVPALGGILAHNIISGVGWEFFEANTIDFITLSGTVSVYLNKANNNFISYYTGQMIIDNLGNIVHRASNGFVTRVDTFKTSTVISEQLGSPIDFLACDTNNNIYYFTQSTNPKQVKKVDVNGVSTTFFVPNTGYFIDYLSIDNDNNVIAISNNFSGGSEVLKITPGGMSTLVYSPTEGTGSAMVDWSGTLYLSQNSRIVKLSTLPYSKKLITVNSNGAVIKSNEIAVFPNYVQGSLSTNAGIETSAKALVTKEYLDSRLISNSNDLQQVTTAGSTTTTTITANGFIKTGGFGSVLLDNGNTSTIANLVPWTKSGNNLYNSNTGNTGIGTGVTIPSNKLEIGSGIENESGLSFRNFKKDFGSVTTIPGVDSSTGRSTARDSENNIYLGYATSPAKIFKVTPGDVVTEVGTFTGDCAHMAVDNLGNIYIPQYSSGSVLKMDTSGVVTTFSTFGVSPYDCEFDSLGNLFVTDYGGTGIYKITPDGNATFFAATGTFPFIIKIVSNDDMFVANSGSGNIVKVTPAGVVTTVGSTPINVVAMALDSQNNIYSTHYGPNRLNKLTQAGVSTTISSTLSYGVAVDLNDNVHLAGNTNGANSQLRTYNSSGVLIAERPLSIYTYDLIINEQKNILYSINATTAQKIIVAETEKPLTVNGLGKLISSSNISVQGGKMTLPNSTILETTNDITGKAVITKEYLESKQIQRLAQYTVATLPTGVQGDTAYVTDALTPTYIGTLTGGGSVVCPVFFNGTNWVAH